MIYRLFCNSNLAWFFLSSPSVVQMKFVEKCFQLEDNIFRIRDDELCAAVTFQSIQKHLYHGHIHFSFLIKKNCTDLPTTIDGGNKKCCDTSKAKAADSKPFSFANKGVIRSNNARKSQSIPSGSMNASKVAANPTNATNSANSQVSLPSISNEVATKSQPPDYSSINRASEDKAPAFGNPFHRSNSNDEVREKRHLSPIFPLFKYF